MGTKSENKLGDPVFLLQFFNALYKSHSNQ